MLVTIVVFLLILSVLVLIHEAGHYFTAKFFGIKVEEFGFGFPLTRPIFQKKHGETLYSFYPVLIGGFVKLYGEDEAGGGRVDFKSQAPDSKLDNSSDMVESKKFSMKEEEILISPSGSIVEEEEVEISEKITIESKNKQLSDIDRAFYSKPVWQRAVVICAGVFMNFVLSLLIISFLFSVVGVAIPGKNVVVDQVVKGAPADLAGLKTGDIIEKINNQAINTPTDLVSYTKKHLGEKLTIQIKNPKSQIQIIKLTPRKNYPKNEGAMGVAISQSQIIKKYPVLEAPIVGMKEVISQTGLIIGGLVMVVSQLILHGSVPQDVAGPIGIAELTGTVVKIGPSAVLSFISLLSLNLAIINILPIPALDGGRLLFILIEGLTGRKVSPKIENLAHTIGMIVLLTLIALITLHDLFRIFSGQSIIPK